MASPVYGRPLPRTITQWIESKNFVQVESADTVAEILDKFRNITNTLCNEMGAINRTTGVIEPIFWGDIMTLLEKFLEKRPRAYQDLEQTSLIDTGTSGIFSPSTQTKVTSDQLRIWLKQV